MSESDQDSVARYRVLDPETYEQPEGHRKIGDREYLAPSVTGLDALEFNDVIEVVDWDHTLDDGTEVEFSPSTPPEPVVRDDGSIELLYVSEQRTGGLQTVELGTWECQRCGTLLIAGVSDGSLVEPNECEGCERKGPFEHAGDLGRDVVQAALRAGDMWCPPSNISDGGYHELWGDVRQYLHDHWDASEPEVYDGLTAYALSTWVRENHTFVPHLMLMGKTTGGKTRLLNTLTRVSYRAVMTASATPASMFRLIDAYNVTYYISEYHGLDYDTRGELDNVIRAGQKRGEVVTRAEPASDGYEPMVFDPFSHIAVATQYTPDDDIVNRCIQIRSSSADRDMPATLDEERARDLRNRLLYARFRLYDSPEWDAAESDAYAYLHERGIDGRTREKLLGLLTVAHLWDRVDDLGPFVDAVVDQDREAAADSEDAQIVTAIRDLAFEELASTNILGDGDPFAAVEIPYSDVAERYEDMTGSEKSASAIGHVRSRLGLEKEKKRDGTVISDPDLGPKLQALCDDMSLGWEPLDSHEVAPELPEEDIGHGTCTECGRDRHLTHEHEGDRICGKCAHDLEASA